MGLCLLLAAFFPCYIGCRQAKEFQLFLSLYIPARKTLRITITVRLFSFPRDGGKVLVLWMGRTPD